MILETNRLIIKQFELNMAYDVHINSLDEDVKKFIPDEYFETEEDARETIEFLISRYESKEGPFVYPIFLKSGENIGYIQLVKIDLGFEVGYHVAKKYTRNGYATEALKAFIVNVINKMNINEFYGITLIDNIASQKVLEKCKFVKFFQGIGKYHDGEYSIVKYYYKNEKI